MTPEAAVNAERLTGVTSKSPVWRLSLLEIRILWVAAGLSCLARIQAFLPGYSLDDYDLILRKPDEQALAAFMRSQGRGLVSYLRQVLIALDLLPPIVSVLGCAVLTVALILVGLAACRMWGIENRRLACYATVLIIVLHPYQAELFTFKTASLFCGIAFALCAIGLAICVRSRLWWAAGVAAFVGGLATYQIIVNYAVMLLLFSLLFALDASPGRRTELLRDVGKRLAAFIAALVIYSGLNAAAVIAYHAAVNGRARPLPFSEFGNRLHTAIGQLIIVLGGTEPIMPRTAKWLLLLVPVIWCAAMLVKPEWRRAALLFCCMLIALPAIIGVILILREWWPVPRVLTQASIFLAGVAAFCITRSPVRLQRVLAGIVFVAVASFMGSNSHVLRDQLRLNVRDQAKANRIVMRLESLPDFLQLRGLAIIGGHWSYPLPISTMEGDLNVSALYAAWSKTAVVSEVSGYAFESAPDHVQNAAVAYCSKTPPWPAAGSVSSIESFGVVCLAR